ncbi:UPF0481 protein At3g47200 [Eucalyptus grandis]|uniref:UPF0481 protein At3g47200 n=1 Tax=Eucalyptus grandis TaxID=71139 RepID=UPI00192EEAD2|nr:UPF0481 protein At3g47200 [Eucalyptus grandis]
MSNPQRNQHARNGDQSGMQDHVSIYVQNILHGVPTARPEHSIFRVRHQLRGVNEKAYEPEILAIGPYHSGNDKFKFMEEQKLRYVKRLLWRRREGSVDKYMPALRSMEQWARDCYAEAVDLSQENFLAMMLIDGLFLVELFRKNSIKELRDEDDPVMKEDWIRFCLPRDLVLLENQIPFLILEELYGLTKGPEEHSELIDVATRYLNFVPSDSNRGMLRESKHLLHLMHTCLTGLPRRHRLNPRTKPMTEKFMSPAELREFGVRFRVKKSPDLLDITFKDGTLEIPVLTVQDHTESQLRNLIAYEQHRPSGEVNYMTDYVTFMDCLIDSSKDVELLRAAGIIKNYMGDDEAVAQMFNEMGDYVTLSNFYYDDIFRRLNAHCKKRWNRSMAKLRREHLHSPWALLSISAATMLLLLTVAQTVLTYLAYRNEGKKG